MIPSLRQWLTSPVSAVKAWKTACLAKLRAHITLAVADDFRQIARHVTAERAEQTSQTQKMLSEQAEIAHQSRADFDQKFDELTLATESLVLEVVRMQQRLADLSPLSVDRLDVFDRFESQPPDDSLPVRRAA